MPVGRRTPALKGGEYVRRDDNTIKVESYREKGRTDAEYLVKAMRALMSDDAYVELKARGNAISRAANIAERLKNNGQGLKYDRVDIDTESMKGKDGKERRVTTINIKLKKMKK